MEWRELHDACIRQANKAYAQLLREGEAFQKFAEGVPK
jgi:hypothetical protein